MESPTMRTSSQLSSPSSSAFHPSTKPYPLPITRSYLYHGYSPGTFHLLPCTVDQYFVLLPVADDHKYELVDEILWCKLEIGSHTHDEALDRNAAELFRHYGEKGCEAVTRRSLDATGSSNSQPMSSRLRSSSSTSRHHRSHTIRIPDVAVFELSKAPNRDNLSPQSKNFTFPREYPPLLVMEITSPTTRDADLTSKWHDYEQAEIQCYVIVDLAHERNPSVIVGMLTRGTYRKSIYRGDDVVRGLPFDELEFSARYLLDPPRSVTEINNSPIKKLKSLLRDRDRILRDQDLALRDLDLAHRDLDLAHRDRDRILRDQDLALRDLDLAHRDRDRILRDLDLAHRDQDRILRDQDRILRDQDRTIRDLRRQLANLTEQNRSSSKAHGSPGKQSASSSSAGSSSSEGHETPKGNSPSKPPRDKKLKVNM